MKNLSSCGFIGPCFAFVAGCLFLSAASAQSVSENLPAVFIKGDTSVDANLAKEKAPAQGLRYTIADIKVDVTADTAAHARDQALIQAERQAYTQLCARLGTEDNSASLSDDDLAAMVKSFEVQSERLSAVRYIGTFTVHFKPGSIEKNFNEPAEATPSAPPVAFEHVVVAVRADSLAAWTEIQRRLGRIPSVSKIDVLDLGRGLIHADLSYSGSFDDLVGNAASQGFIIRTSAAGVFELYDSQGGMVP